VVGGFHKILNNLLVVKMIQQFTQQDV